MRIYALAIALFLPAGSALASGAECMGSAGKRWVSIDAPVAMRPGFCPATIELPSGFSGARYSLATEPSKFPGKTVCTFTWVPGSGGVLEPENSILTVICTLNH